MSAPTTKTELEYCRKHCPKSLGWDDKKRSECRAKTACEPFRELFRAGEAKGMSTSDTPRTDANCPVTISDHMGNEYEADLVSADFARQLERELNEARDDSERLDWLAKNEARVELGIRTGCRCMCCWAWKVFTDDPDNPAGEDEHSLRAAIDAAREGGR